MMKKMMILGMVLAMASLASAGYVLTGEGQPAGTVEADGTYGAFFISVIGDADLTLLYTPTGSGLTDYTGADVDLTAGLDFYAGAPTTAIYFAEFVDLSAVTVPEGSVLSMIATKLPTPAIVTLHDAETLEVLSQVTLIPEPMTLGLLGLGGLFLRRRK